MGLGMVLAAGCPFRLITRSAEGDLTAWFAILGFIGGIVIFAYLLPTLQCTCGKVIFSKSYYLSDIFKMIFR